jgi:tricarballylate dehydrogenase
VRRAQNGSSGTARPWWDEPWQVVVIGGGNAALVSAIAARQHAERVLLIERAPMELRGGNTRHTRNVRCVHDGADVFVEGSYLYQELWDDLCQVGTGPTDEKLAALTVRESETVPPWMARHGVRWQAPLTGTLSLGRTNRFFLGGGKALVNTYHRTLEQLAIQVVYDATVEELVMAGDRCTGVIVSHPDGLHQVEGAAVVCASGGFEANLDWLRRYWGDAVDNYIIRGTPYNDGRVLASLYGLGAAPAGQEKGFHAVAVDARAPRFDGGIATRLDTIPFSIVVNGAGRRFYDEGEALWPKRYAIWGRNIAEQPGQIAWSIWDAKVRSQFLPPMYGAARADTVEQLADDLGLDTITVRGTIDAYNQAVVAGGTFDPSVLDNCHTVGLDPPKSHWAQRIDTPPYFGIAMRPGITFTYMGARVDEDARVLRTDGTAFPNVFAAGEIMSGNILSTGYLAGFGMTIGTVWGRIAGGNAARAARD